MEFFLDSPNVEIKVDEIENNQDNIISPLDIDIKLNNKNEEEEIEKEENEKEEEEEELIYILNLMIFI